MNFKEVYTRTAGEIFISYDKNGKEIETPKILLSVDAYAIGEMISELINKIEHARTSFIK